MAVKKKTKKKMTGFYCKSCGRESKQKGTHCGGKMMAC